MKKQKNISIHTEILKIDNEEPNVKIISTDNRIITKIIHISDIHIRNDRIDEYKIVFDNLINELKNIISYDDSLIVITGDILDKYIHEYNTINLLKYLFHELSNLCEIITIIGNHDTNLKGNYKEDGISSIIDNYFLSKHKIHLLLDKCIYEYNNIYFGLTTMKQYKITKIDHLNGKTKIALYHGTLNGSNIEHFTFSNNTFFNVKDFKDYDYVLLGDIHKHQFLNNNIWYAGSLIQQNYKEHPFEHGYVLLDLDTKKIKFNTIKNDYGMFIIEIDKDGKTNYDIEKLTKNVKIQLVNKGADYKTLNNVYEIICNTKNVIGENKIINNPKIKGKNINENEIYSKIIKFTTKEEIATLICDVIKKENKENVLAEELMYDIHNKITNILIEQDFIEKSKKIRKLKLIYLKFNKFMSYEGNNEIDFTNFNNDIMNGTLLILSGENSSGKSTIIDAIIFAITGKTNRKSNLIELINVNENSLNTEIKIMVNDIEYIISRKISRRGKNGFISGIELFEIINNEKKNLTQNKNDTEKIIEENIVSYQELLTTSILCQDDITNFIKLSGNERYELLCKFSGVNFLNLIKDNIETKINCIRHNHMIKNEHKNKLSNYYTNNNFNIVNIVETITKKIQEYQYQINGNINFKNNFIKELDIQNIKLGSLLNQYDKLNNNNNNNIQNSNIEIDKINIEINNILNNLKLLNIEKNSLENNKNIIEEQIQKYNINNNEFNIQKTKDINEIEKKINELKNKIIYYNKEEEINLENINEKNSLLEIEKNINNLKKIIIPNNKLNIINIFHNKYIKKNEDLQNEINDLKFYNKHIKFLNNCIKRLEKSNEECVYCNNLIYKKYLIKEIKLLENTINICKNKINNIKIFLNKNKIKYNNNIEKINNNNINEEEIINLNNKMNLIDIIKNNKLINEEINNYIEKKTKYINEYNDYNNLQNKLNNINKNINDININILKQEQENKKNIEKYDYFSNIINNIIENEKIEKEINDITNNINNTKNVINDLDTEINNINNNLIVYNIDLINANEYKNKIDDNNKELISYEKIITAIMGENILNDILKSACVIMENFINKYIIHIFDCEILIKLNEKNIIINTNNKNNKNIDVFLMGGFELKFLNLLYRLALTKINDIFSTDFIILDEVLDASDYINKEKIIKFLEQLRLHFNWTLLISHDEQLCNINDKQLIISNDNNGNKTINIL